MSDLGWRDLEDVVGIVFILLAFWAVYVLLVAL
jgi:hypothetical protein